MPRFCAGHQAPAPRPARPTTANPAGDEPAVRAAAQAYAMAYNDGDAKALAALWTIDGDYTDSQGITYSGREAIEKLFATEFAARPAAELEVQTESVRFLSPDVAIENGVAWSTPAHGNRTTTRYQAVLVKRSGNWLMASAHDSARLAASSGDYLRDLEWLVGGWQATTGDSRLNVTVEWTGNKNFLLRKFQVETAGKLAQSGTQIIGWDPRTGEIVSWSFESDGSFGQDRWNKQGGRWYVEAQGVAHDAAATTAINILTPIDADSFSWQSTARTAAGAALPDTEAVKLTRVRAR